MVFMISWGNPATPYWLLKEPDLELTPSQNLRKVRKLFRPSRYFIHRKKEVKLSVSKEIGKKPKIFRHLN